MPGLPLELILRISTIRIQSELDTFALGYSTLITHRDTSYHALRAELIRRCIKAVYNLATTCTSLLDHVTKIVISEVAEKSWMASSKKLNAHIVAKHHRRKMVDSCVECRLLQKEDQWCFSRHVGADLVKGRLLKFRNDLKWMRWRPVRSMVAGMKTSDDDSVSVSS